MSLSLTGDAASGELSRAKVRCSSLSSRANVRQWTRCLNRRVGHSSPAITLRVYSHLFADTDTIAADAIDRVLGANRCQNEVAAFGSQRVFKGIAKHQAFQWLPDQRRYSAAILLDSA